MASCRSRVAARQLNRSASLRFSAVRPIYRHLIPRTPAGHRRSPSGSDQHGWPLSDRRQSDALAAPRALPAISAARMAANCRSWPWLEVAIAVSSRRYSTPRAGFLLLLWRASQVAGWRGPSSRTSDEEGLVRKIDLLATAIGLIFGSVVVLAGPLRTSTPTDSDPVSTYHVPVITNAIWTAWTYGGRQRVPETGTARRLD